MEITRRQFFGGASATLVMASASSYAEAIGANKPRLKFGVLSDLHIAPAEDVEQYLKGDRSQFVARSTELLQHAIEYFDAQGVDAVAIAGDITDWGLISQFRAFVACWQSVFPDNRSRRDGRPVTCLPVMGNHDVAFRAWSVGNYITKAIGQGHVPPEEIFKNDIAGNWQKVFGEPYAPIFLKQVKGYSFVGVHWDTRFYPKQSYPELADFLARHRSELSGSKPFFALQHPQPRGTCLKYVNSADDGSSTAAWSAFANAVVFSGHSHRSLMNEMNVWQDTFTSIGTATLDSPAVDRGHDDSAKTYKNHRRAMPALRGRTSPTCAAHGQLVAVYDDFLEISRREFMRDHDLGPNLVVPLPANRESPFFFANRERAAKKPAPFPQDATVKVLRVGDKVHLTFPAVQAHDYEISAIASEDGAERHIFRRYVYGAETFLAPEDRSGLVKATFRADLFPENCLVRFEVRAREAFGNTNEPIHGRFNRVPHYQRGKWEIHDGVTIDSLAGFTPGKEPPLTEYGGWKVGDEQGTGFFRVTKRDGRWWLVDPAGRLFISKGLAVFRPGKSDRQVKVLKEKFGSEVAWANDEIPFVKEHGFNTAGGWSWPGLSGVPGLRERLPHTVVFDTMGSFMGKTKGEVLPPVFDPRFDDYLEKKFGRIDVNANDPWLIGYFLDNEIPWKNKALEHIMANLPPDHPTRKGAEAWLKARYRRDKVSLSDISAADGPAFTADCFEIYIKKIVAQFRKHDPNHIFLGCRFCSWNDELANERLFKIAGKYMDIISVNHYGPWEPDPKVLSRWTDWSGHPIMITEFYTKGNDSGLGNTTGAGRIVPTQDDRGIFYENFTYNLLKVPGCVGWHWFTYIDNDPTNRKTDPSNRDSNKGVVTWDYRRYSPLLRHMKAFNAQVYNLIQSSRCPRA